MQRERARRLNEDRQPSRETRSVAPPRPVPAAVLEEQRAGRDAFLAEHEVSRETLGRLDRYVAMLNEWQSRINLVAPASLGEVWSRHLADCLHLERLLPDFARAVDIGSGAGLPGAVVAIRRPCAPVDLIESNAKKAAFLRAVQRELELSGRVHAARIEASAALLAEADVVTARALAPLGELLKLVAPSLKAGARCFFQKGRNHEQEINEASAHWRFRVLKHESPLQDGSVVLELADIARR